MHPALTAAIIFSNAHDYWERIGYPSDYSEAKITACVWVDFYVQFDDNNRKFWEKVKFYLAQY